MNSRQRIALVGLSTLESLGIRSILRDGWDGTSEYFPSFEEFYPFSEKMAGYIVAADIFIYNMDFFLPRKMKTLIVARNVANCADHSGLLMLSAKSDEAEIKGKLKEFLAPQDDGDDTRGDLSAREIEVLRLIAAGKINKEIADELCISVNTVITHRKNLSSKLGIKSASGLSLYAMMNGFI